MTLFLPWGVFLLVYFDVYVLTGSALLFNAVGLLVGINLHVVYVGPLLRWRARQLSDAGVSSRHPA